MVRLFVAAWPSEAVVAGLAELAVPEEPGVRPVPPSNWHVTLRFLGDAEPEAVVARLGATPLPSATVVLGPRIRRLGRRQLVIPVAGADRLASAVRAATRGIGRPDRRSFVGHLTVARTQPDAGSTLLAVPFEASMTIDEVAVVRSDVGPTGATYDTIATVPTVEEC